jgi:hypothetical protein
MLPNVCFQQRILELLAFFVKMPLRKAVDRNAAFGYTGKHRRMSKQERKFRIVSIALSLVVLGVLTFALFAPTNAIEFDPNGTYKEALDLPDSNPRSLATQTIQWALGLLGLVAVVMIIFGGFMWMTSAGNEQRVTKGKEILQWAVIGLVVILLSWAIVIFVFRTATQ